MFSPKNLILLLALLWGSFALQAQSCFIQEDDATGSLAFSTAQLAELEAAACSLREVFPEEFHADFAVYDFGFYLHQESYVGGTPQIFQDRIAKIEQQTPYFLVFGRQLLRDGVLGKVWVEVLLPEDNAYPCFEDRQWTISNLVNIAVEEALGQQAYLSSTSFVNASIAAISTLQTEVDHAVNCCDLQRSVVEGCPICPIEGQNYRELLRKSGYIQLSNVSNIRIDSISSVAEEVTQQVVVDVVTSNRVYATSYDISQELINAKVALGDNIFVSVRLYDTDSVHHCSELAELVGIPITSSAIINIGAGYDYYEEIIVLREGESVTLFSRVGGGGGSNGLLDKIGSNNRLPILPAIVLRIVLRRAVMAASNIAVNLVMEILMERGFGDHGPDCTWIETASYVNMSFWRLAAWGAEGAIGGDNTYVAAIFGALDGAIQYLYTSDGINNFDAEVFFWNVVQGAAGAVIGQSVAGFFLNNTTVGNFISQFQSNSTVNLQNELIPLAWDFILNPRMRRAWEGLFNVPVLRVESGYLEIASSYMIRTGRSHEVFSEELFTNQSLVKAWLDEQALGIYRFTSIQVEKYVDKATRQTSKSKVMLGMWDGGSTTSYIERAGTDYTYLDFQGADWDEALGLIEGGSNDWVDEMWKLNKFFLEEQRSLGKEFWFSHDPFSPTNEQFFSREVNWMIDQGVQDFQKVGDLWKAIW
jgi:hypothetical protein